MTGRILRRIPGEGTVVTLGTLTALAHLYHLIDEQEMRARVLGVLVPFALSFLLVGAGVWLYRSRLDVACRRRVAVWTGVGLVGGAVFGYPVVPYQAAHGVTIVDVRFLVTVWVTAGSLVGFVVGVYDARQGRYRLALEAERAELAGRERELERQNERLEQFASAISHDLRNPLNVASGRLELARREDESEHLDIARGALERMEALVDGLLTLARQGRPIDETVPVSLSTLADQCWAVVDTKDATLTVEQDGRFAADPARLQQLLENLFRNSVEHSSTGSRAQSDDSVEHGGADVAVRVGVLADRTGFYVEDDGPGIPEGEREEVFVSGYSTAPEGTGFGLAIVAEIVDAHGWEIGVTESDEGGARFEIRGIEVGE